MQCQTSFKDIGGPMSPIVSAFAGPMCTPWSAFGSNLGEAHPCMESYLVWQEDCAVNDYDKTTMENNEWFPLSFFENRFAGQARVVSIVASSNQIGFPIVRRRLFATALHACPRVMAACSSDLEFAIRIRVHGEGTEYARLGAPDYSNCMSGC